MAKIRVKESIMPANFTKEEREQLFEKFYKKGYQLLKKHGYKKLKISDIATSVSIGTGTFYNFFKSKDEFIIWLIKKRKMESFNKFILLAKKYNDKIPQPAMEDYLFEMISSYNIYRLLSQDDYNILQKKHGLLKNRDENIEKSGKFILEKLDSRKNLDDFKLFSQAFTIIIIGTSDLTKLDPNLADDATKKLIHSACQILY